MSVKNKIYLTLGLFALAIGALYYNTLKRWYFVHQFSSSFQATNEKTNEQDGFFLRLAKFAEERTWLNIQYDGSYFPIAYPMGDIDPKKGVCTDVVIRSYRKLGIDLQELVHEDMVKNFSLYPKLWGLSEADTNIDHRRVPNLMVFFKRKNASLPISDSATAYEPGDIVAWDLGFGVTHIGVVSSKKNEAGVPLIVHNIGAGPKLEDMLFNYRIIGHFRYQNLDIFN